MMILSKQPIERVLRLSAVIDAESQEKIMQLPKPREVYGKETPENLNGITIGELFELQEAISTDNMHTIVAECARVLLAVPQKKVMRHRADRAMGFTLWVLRELERIAKMWKAITPSPCAEAVQAGVEMLDYGNFGTIDWFARRMGIADHDIVMRLPWVRLYKCMEIDNKNAQFQERLREVYAKQSTKR